MLSPKPTPLADPEESVEDKEVSAPSFTEIRREIARMQTLPLEALFQPTWINMLLRALSLRERWR